MYHFIRRKDLPYIILVMITGSLSHFLYEFSNKNPITALIAPINESVWEHMKLLFFPFLIFSLAEYALQKPDASSFFESRLIGVWSGILFITLCFYGYSGIFGRTYTFLDILLFFLGVIAAFYVSAKHLRHAGNLAPVTIFLLWFASLLTFFIFTCFPPELPLFLPPF